MNERYRIRRRWTTGLLAGYEASDYSDVPLKVGSVERNPSGDSVIVYCKTISEWLVDEVDA